MKKEIAIIIPVHEYNDEVKEFLSKALNSIKEQTDLENVSINIVCPYNIEYDIKLLNSSELVFNVLVNYSDKFDYQSQVNTAVMLYDAEYFTVLEFDDELSKNYIKNVDQYVNSYPDVAVYMSLIVEKNNKNEAIKFTNETVWAQQFVGDNGEIGYLNNDSLKQYSDFKLSGAVFNRKKYLEVGGYKSNIKLAFMYEFLLRAINNNLKIMTIPKIIYSHLATRENSLFGLYSKNMSMEERKFWFEQASKEYNFKKDRVFTVPIF
jgi:hypothetical protein